MLGTVHACRHMPVMRVKNRANQVQRHRLALVLSALGLGLLVWVVVSLQYSSVCLCSMQAFSAAVRPGCWLLSLPTCIAPGPGAPGKAGCSSIQHWAIQHGHAAFTWTPGIALFLLLNLCSQHLPSRLPCAADLCVLVSCHLPVCRAGEAAYRCRAGWTKHWMGKGRMSHQRQVQCHMTTVCWAGIAGSASWLCQHS